MGEPFFVVSQIRIRMHEEMGMHVSLEAWLCPQTLKDIAFEGIKILLY